MAALLMQLILGAPPSPIRIAASTPTLGSSCNGYPPHAINSSRFIGSSVVGSSVCRSAACRFVALSVRRLVGLSVHRFVGSSVRRFLGFVGSPVLNAISCRQLLNAFRAHARDHATPLSPARL